MKKGKVQWIILLCLWLLPVLFPAAAYASVPAARFAGADMSAQQEQFQIGVECGWKGMSRSSSAVPVSITVTNNGPEFKGTLKAVISVESSGGSNIASRFLDQLFIHVRSASSNRNQTVTHEIPIELGPKETVTRELTLTLSEYGPAGVSLLLEDGKGKTVYSVQEEISAGDPSHSRIAVGIVETDNSCAGRIDNMQIGEFYQIDAVSVSPGDFTEKMILSGKPDVLIFLEQSREALNKKEREVVERWEESGGILIDFWDASYTLDGSEAYAPELMRKVFRIDPQKMMEILLSQEVLTRIPSVRDSYYDPVYENSWILEEKAIRRQPDSILFIGLIFGYAVLVGPVLYLILKKRKKHRYLWPAICALSFAFVILITALGSRTVMRAPVIVYKNSLAQRGERLEETLNFEIQAPYNSGCKLYLDPSYRIVAGTAGSLTSMAVFEGGGDAKDGFEQIRIRYEESRNEAELSNQPAFALNAFELSRTLPLTDGGVSAKFRWSAGEVSGSVANHSGYDLEDCVLMLPGHMAYIGDLKNGETLDTDGIAVESVRDSSAWLEQKLGEGERTGAFCVQAGKWDLNRSEDSLLIAAVKNWDPAFQMNSGYETKGETLYTAKAEIDRHQEDGTLYCPYAQEYYETDQQPFGYGRYPGSLIMDGQQIEVTYHLNAALEESVLREKSIAGLFLEIFGFPEYVDEMGNENVENSLDYICTLMQNPEEITAMQEGIVEQVEFSRPDVLAEGWEAFDGTIEVYNHSTGMYEVLEDWKLDDNSGKYQIPSPYLKNGNRLTVRYTLTEEELSSEAYQDMGAFQLPDLTVRILEYPGQVLEGQSSWGNALGIEY